MSTRVTVAAEFESKSAPSSRVRRKNSSVRPHQVKNLIRTPKISTRTTSIKLPQMLPSKPCKQTSVLEKVEKGNYFHAYQRTSVISFISSDITTQLVPLTPLHSGLWCIHPWML